MSASKQPTERRLSPTKLLNLSYPRNKWLSALREEIINSNVKAWDFRIAIFFISLLIYLPIFSALTSWLPTIITGNTFFLLFGLTLSYILAGKTFVVLKQQAEADKEREKNVLAEQTQGDQHGGAPKRDRANFLLFSKKSGEPYPLWLRNLYSYFFSLKEKQTHYTLTFMFMLIITIIIGYIDLGIGKVFIFLPIFINYTIGLAFTVTINMVCIILLTISIHLLREDAGREEAIMLELNRREQEEKLRQRFAETSKQSFEIQDESPNELLASEYETLSQYDHRYQRPDWIRMPRNLMASFTSKSEFSLFMILTIFFFFILYLMKAPELINPQIIFYKIFSFKITLQVATYFIIAMLSLTLGLVMEKVIHRIEIVSKKDMDRENKVLESRTRKEEINVFQKREGQIPPPGFIREHRYTGTIENLSLKGFAPSTISPDRSTKATIQDNNNNILLKNAYTDKILHNLSGHYGKVQCVTWSPDGKILASGGEDWSILLWNTLTGKLLPILMHHSGAVTSLTFSPDGQILVSGSEDCTFRLWNPKTGDLIRTFEVHTSTITMLSFTYDGRLLASMSSDGSVIFWRTDTWEQVLILNEQPAFARVTHIAFDSYLPRRAEDPPRLAAEFKNIYYTYTYIWRLDIEQILGLTVPSSHAWVSYVNAKVVLVGNSGVGKSGLGLRLSGEDFKPTDSTHGRHIWTLERKEEKLDEQHIETHEVLLWDLAGQPDYQLIHQLHLNEVTVALVVFDGRDVRSSSDPFAGVSYWDNALQQAQRENTSEQAANFIKFLVAARTDVDSIGISDEQIKMFADAHGFRAYFKTSAKEGNGISELRQAILDAINWSHLTKIRSPMLFQRIKVFLIQKKETGYLLLTIDELFRGFLEQNHDFESVEKLHEQFEFCIRQVESAGLIKRLSFARLVLLQPELLDAYASALVKVVKQATDLGNIAEAQVLKGDFPIPERIKDRSQERLLLSAMVEYLLDRDLALREENFLIFPSQVTLESPDLLDIKGEEIRFDFEGAIPAIYATLAVRLARSGFFKKQRLWKNAITYTTNVGGTYGLLLHNIDNGRGNLTLFFGSDAGQEAKSYFEEFVQYHLQRRALPRSIKRQQLLVCNNCGVLIPEEVISRQEGQTYVYCYACGTPIQLSKPEQLNRVAPSLEVLEMDHTADQQRQAEVDTSSRAANQQLVKDKEARGEFDVFLCHNSIDKPEVKKIGEKLKERGILPWLDEWELRPGLLWQDLLEKQIGQIKSAAVFIGKDGIGPWQHIELGAFLSEFVERGCPVIPILLPYASQQPQLPIFLKGLTWVDFRVQYPDPMERLIWGITGNRGKIQ